MSISNVNHLHEDDQILKSIFGVYKYIENTDELLLTGGEDSFNLKAIMRLY
jgi:hypothetical protein